MTNLLDKFLKMVCILYLILQNYKIYNIACFNEQCDIKDIKEHNAHSNRKCDFAALTQVSLSVMNCQQRHVRRSSLNCQQFSDILQVGGSIASSQLSCP